MNRITFPLKQGMQGAEVGSLQNALQLCIDRRVVLATDDVARREMSAALTAERAQQTYGSATAKLVSLFQDERRLTANGDVDEATAKALNELLRQWGVLDARIEGRVLLPHGAPAGDVKLRLYRLDFGGAATLLDETTTLAGGEYAFSLNGADTTASVQMRIVDPAGAETPISRPLDHVRGESRADLNLIAPETLRPLAAEYRRLSSDLAARLGQIGKLAEARENGERRDLTVLNRATGWDARLIALAATAERLSADPDVQLPQEHVYGLLRAGLPSDKLTLSQVEPDVAEQALKAVRDARIVELSDQQIADFKTKFAAFATKARLNIIAPGSRATYGQLLNASGLSRELQDKFATVYLRHRGTGEQLWEEARKAGFDEGQVRTLQLQGKLAFLAGNSVGMTARLLGKQLNDPVELVGQDFHRADAWVKEVLGQAGIPLDRRNNLTDADKQKLDSEIPARYSGDTIEARLEAYAADMARKISRSYPTHVVGRMIAQDAIPLPASRDDTVALMKNAAGQGFRLGETPVHSFLAAHPGVRAGMTEADFQSAQEQLKTLQRVYQITPGNESMPVLFALKMTSAYDVTAYPEAEFIALYESKYAELHGKPPTPAEARLVYRKARQVTSVTFNLFAIAGKVDTEPALAGLSAPPVVRDAVRNGLIKQFPTLESLFGSMDFCECEHCRSVLSPAAYLVDLLQLVDPEPREWDNFLARWKATHNQQDYPHPKPYDVLLERRPDLPHIALTCENTHTALPYIDIVNEILEYYVAHGALDQDAARDTGDATTAELLAEPQHVTRDAYEELRKARYPLALPFDLWSETARQFCAHFETPMWRAMDALRSTDALFAPAEPFDRFTVFMEMLGLSPAELAVFINPDPLATWHELYGYATPAEATTEAIDAGTGQRIDLHSARTLARRLGITYEDLVEIVQTAFVNPELAKLGLLYKLGVSISDARFFLDHRALLPQDPATLSADDRQRQLEAAAFAQKLAAAGIPETEIAAIPFGAALVLADPSGGGFDLTTLRFADGTPTDGLTFLKINLFVRLWRKMGWSIEETARALDVFVPANTPFAPQHFAAQPLKTALIYLAHLKELGEMLRPGKQTRLALLTMWADLPITGRNPLYAQLFLTRSVLTGDPIFDDPHGRYLSPPFHKLVDHVMTVQTVLGVSASDIGLVLEHAGQAIGTADLSVANLSLLYRHAWLAKALKLSVRELVALEELSGLDPFSRLDPEPLSDLQRDHPFTQTLRIVEIAGQLKDSGLTLADLDYLLRDRVDHAGKHRADPDATLALLKTLADGVRAIRAEHAVPDDPIAMTDEVLRQKLGLVLAPDVAARFLAMMNGTAEFTATVTPSNPPLDPAAFAGEPAIRQLRHNTTRQEQKLTFKGVLFDAQKAALTSTLPAAVPPNPHVPSPIFAALLDDVQAQARAFFDTHLRKRTDAQPAGGFLDPADFDLLFDATLPAGETEAGRLRKRRTALANAFFPFLQQRLIRNFVVETMAAHTGDETALVESLLTDARLLGDPQSLLDAFVATASAPGAGFFDAAGMVMNPGTDARFDGYLEVPRSGAYRFHVVLDKQNARAELRFDHLPNPVFLSGTAASDHAILGEGPTEFLELQAGRLYRFSLELTGLNGGGARVLVQGDTLAKAGMSQLTLYSRAAFERAEHALALLVKHLALARILELNEREVRHLLTRGGAFHAASAIPEAFARVLRWAAYARLKGALAGGGDTLIDLYEANDSSAADKLEKIIYPLIARMTNRDEATVMATAQLLAPATPSGFDSERPLLRLHRALDVVHRFGVPAAVLREWMRVAGSSAPVEPRFEMARDVKAALKAGLEPHVWQRVAQPMFDRLRQRQRDALSAYVMQRLRLDRQEQLYEHFLIDPGMEPVVQTSRIRLAIASLQLFVQRSLLNMETKVHPSIINSKHWDWMKRYRVWEAGRKIFLFPENWLEPEFRDDKTHLFAELEGALLQGDVSNDLAEDAFHQYLKELDQLARLEIVGLHMDETQPGAPVLHVIGRTYAKPHKHFYRRYARQMWTPWEPVSAEVEGNHLAPVVWRDRLYLFWVTFMDKPMQNQQYGSSTGNTSLAQASLSSVISHVSAAGRQKHLDVELHWAEYVAGEWSVAESSGFMPVTATQVRSSGHHLQDVVAGEFADIATVELAEEGTTYSPPRLKVPLNFDVGTVFIHVSKEPYTDGEERGVYIHLRGGGVNQAFFVPGRNAAPESVLSAQAPPNPLSSANRAMANRYVGSGALAVRFARHITTEDGQPPVDDVQVSSILQQCGAYSLVPCDSAAAPRATDAAAPDVDPAIAAAIARGLPEIASLMRPVFFQDKTHTLFVEPTVTERTIDEWQDWVTPTPQPEPRWRDPQWWTNMMVLAETPSPAPADPNGLTVGPESILTPTARVDWLANPATALEFDGVLIGPAGQPGLNGSVGRLNVVGPSGFNAGLARNLESTRSRFGAGATGPTRPER